MKAKKSFGQNWLRDEYVLDKIVDSANLKSTDSVLEVGPGLGTLTQKLVSSGVDIWAVEADQDLIPGLKKRFKNAKNLKIIPEDILKFDMGKMPEGYKVVANIPYYLTSNLIRTLLEASNKPTLMVMLVQKEVAERILAKPGSMSVLAFSVLYYARPEFVMEVGRELFDPIPRVDSSIIKISCLNQQLFDADTQKLFRLVKSGFGEKRKMLRNSLSGGLGVETADIERILTESKISLTSRAQELSMSDWHNLYRASIASNLI